MKHLQHWNVWVDGSDTLNILKLAEICKAILIVFPFRMPVLPELLLPGSYNFTNGGDGWRRQLSFCNWSNCLLKIRIIFKKHGQRVPGTAALHLFRIVLIWCRLKQYAVQHVWAVFAVIDISEISAIGGSQHQLATIKFNRYINLSITSAKAFLNLN